MNSFLAKNPEVLTMPQRLKEPFSWVGHIPFAFHLVKLLEPQILVELGVHTGNSFNAFCQAVKNFGLPTLCYGVDTWQGDSHAGFYASEIYEELLRDLSLQYPGFSNLIRSTFEDALSSFAPGSVDLLHIDGLHTYEAVKQDFTTWLPKLSDKAVVLFHDTVVRSGDFGVWKLWDELSSQYPAFEFKHSFGLGVLAVGKAVPEAVLSCLADLKADLSLNQLFTRLGNSVLWFAEQARFRHLLSDSDLLRERMRRLENKLTDSDLPPDFVAQLSIDNGHGYREIETTRQLINLKQGTLEFACSNLITPQARTARIFFLSEPVMLRVSKVQVFNEAGVAREITDYRSNHLLMDEDVLVFESNLPELSFNLPSDFSVTRIELSLDYIGVGLAVQRRLVQHFKSRAFSDGPSNSFEEKQEERLRETVSFLRSELRSKEEQLRQQEFEHRRREGSLQDELFELQKIEVVLRSQLESQLKLSPLESEGSSLGNRLLATEFLLTKEIGVGRELIEKLQERLLKAENEHQLQLNNEREKFESTISRQQTELDDAESILQGLRLELREKAEQVERLNRIVGSTELVPLRAARKLFSWRKKLFNTVR